MGALTPITPLSRASLHIGKPPPDQAGGFYHQHDKESAKCCTKNYVANTVVANCVKQQAFMGL